MAFLHRKLLNASYLCEPFCDEAKNPDGICLESCMNLCFNCKIVDFPPPPLPPLPPTTYVDHISSKHRKLSLLVTVSLVIVSTLVFFLACYTIYKLCINRYNLRRRQRRFLQPGEQEPSPDAFLDEDQGPNQGPEVEHHVWYIRTIGLEPSVISAITIIKYKKGEGLIEGTDCSVCLNEFQEDETLRLLPKCSHAFHIPCIDTWLRSHTNCPLCRAGIVNNTANLPSQELIIHNSGPVEENLLQISESSEEPTVEESGNEDSELGIGTNDDGLFGVENGLVGIQPARRSASMDALSASMVTAAAANASSAQSQRNSDDDPLDDVKELNEGIVAKRDVNGISERLLRLVGGLSIERPSCIKRSLSCSANV